MSNRAAVKRRIANEVGPVVLASVDLGVTGRDTEAVPCAYSLPPDTATETCVYFGGIDKKSEGRSDPVSLGRAEQSRVDDTFILKGTIDAFGFDSDEDSDEAAERILNTLNAWLRSYPHLIGGDVPDGDIAQVLQKTTVRLADWSLENFSPVGDTHVSRIDFNLECLTTT